MNVLCTPPLTVSVKSAMGFGCAGSSNERMTMPFFRTEEPSRVSTPNFPSSVVMTSLIPRASTTTESVMTGAAGLLTSTAYIRSPTVERYPCRPSGWSQNSAAITLSGSRPTSWVGRRTSRGRAVITASATRPAKMPMTRKVPGADATNFPSVPTSASPPATDHSATASATGRPPADFATRASGTTSPARTDAVAGSIATVVTGFAITFTTSVCVARPAFAVSVALPARPAVMRPPAPTATTAGPSDDQTTSSYLRSPLAEYGTALSVIVCPAYSLSNEGPADFASVRRSGVPPFRPSIAIRAAGCGSTVTRANAVAGRPPLRGVTTAVAISVPVDPPVTMPIESTDPSKNRSEEHTSELQSQSNLVCRLLLEKKKRKVP